MQIFVEEWARGMVEQLHAFFSDAVQNLRVSFESHVEVRFYSLVQHCAFLTECIFEDLVAFYNADWEKFLSLNAVDVKDLSGITFAFAVIWVFGMTYFDRFSRESKKQLQQFLKQKISRIYSSFPMQRDIFDYYVDLKQRRLVPWSKLVPPFLFDPQTPFHSILVPTRETVKFRHNIGLLVGHQQSVLLQGVSGAGKTSIASLFSKSQDPQRTLVTFI